MSPPRRPAPAVVVLLSIAVGVVLTGCLPGHDPERPRHRAGPSGAAVSGAVASFPASDVLRAWDRARARAFADGDVAALRGLYADGSAAGTSDARLLRAYLHRGLRVEGMRMQVLALEVLHEDSRRLRLLVTDRLAGPVAVGRGVRTVMPRDQASTRVVELRRQGVGGRWRVATVRTSSRRPAGR